MLALPCLWRRGTTHCCPQVALEVYDMQGHVFQNEVGENPVAQEAVRRIVDFARSEIMRPETVPSMAARL